MPRIKKPAKVKEPIRLRMKELADGSKSLYLDIYRNGKRSYEYLKMYIIPETDDNARKRNAATMTAANTIKSRRIIELTNGEAGIKRADNQETVSLLDWMNTYMENQQKRGKKDGHQIKVAIQILKDYAGERVTMGQVDKTFCQGYIDYLLTEYRPQGKPVSKFTAQNYYRVLNGALNAAVRADVIKLNPFTKIGNSDKIHRPESKREYMTIEELRALIATPMKNEAVKQAYLFSCFCGLRISDIIGLKWGNVYADNGQYRLEVVMQKTKEPIYLPLSPEALRWMPERGEKMAEDAVFDLPSTTHINILLKPWAKAAGIAVFVPHGEAYVRHDDADSRCRFIHDFEIARAYGREDDAGLRQNHQPQERRSGESGERIVRLIRNRERFGKRFTLLRGRIGEKENKPFLRAEYIALNIAGY